jgi:hypothetical protein
MSLSEHPHLLQTHAYALLTAQDILERRMPYMENMVTLGKCPVQDDLQRVGRVREARRSMAMALTLGHTQSCG